MNFDLTPDQQQIRETVLKLCAQFDDHYWLARDKDGRFPEEFCRAIADGGWVGTAVPEIYGGSGLGTVESALVVQAISESGAANSGVSAIAIGLFGLSPILKYASEAQRLAWLPRIVAREDIACFGVTEPNTGHDTTRLKTRAERRGDHLEGGVTPVRERLWKVRAKQVVLATGAHERPLVFANNDLPGVMLASAVST
jgi:acyl-CoA dehydrogenase